MRVSILRALPAQQTLQQHEVSRVQQLVYMLAASGMHLSLTQPQQLAQLDELSQDDCKVSFHRGTANSHLQRVQLSLPAAQGRAGSKNSALHLNNKHMCATTCSILAVVAVLQSR